ncbi:MAG: hypothetical protein J6B95_02910 [Oscillospiraceae bacterium]|nr:hypothetical protein [Oscillospiraceae bacterium]
MNQKSCFALWGGMFALCAGLGFIAEPVGLLKALMVLLSLGFFVPGFLLLRDARRRGDRNTLALIRNLAALSLLTTLILLIANFLSVMAGEILGSILYYVLIIVSAPMICGQYWAVSLFLWACLMIAAGRYLKHK